MWNPESDEREENRGANDEKTVEENSRILRKIQV